MLDGIAQVEAPTVEAIAKGGNVSVRWLLTGEGRPDDADGDWSAEGGSGLRAFMDGRWVRYEVSSDAPEGHDDEPTPSAAALAVAMTMELVTAGRYRDGSIQRLLDAVLNDPVVLAAAEMREGRVAPIVGAPRLASLVMRRAFSEARGVSGGRSVAPTADGRG